MFLLKKLVTALILPPTGPLLLCILGLLLLRRMPRTGRTLVWLGVLSVFALALPPVAAALIWLAQDSPALDYDVAKQAQAIVILGGGIRRGAEEFGGDTVSDTTLERVRYGAWVAQRTKLPVLVTGGVVYKGVPEGVAMRDALEREFAVPVRWVESASRDTHENAVLSAELLHAAGIHKVVLVGHSVSMRRAAYEFRQAGIDVVPAPTYLPRFILDTPVQLLPSADALRESRLAIHELIGNVAYRMRVYTR